MLYFRKIFDSHPRGDTTNQLIEAKKKNRRKRRLM